MIHTHFTLDKKQYRKTYTSAMMLYYMRIYFITLAIGICAIYLLGRLFKNTLMIQSSTNMMITFIPVILICGLVSLGISLYDVHKTNKKFPMLVEGEFKIRFEKKFMIMQINGKNEKIHYEPYRIYRAYGNGFVLYDSHGKSIVVPPHLVSKEERQKIKTFIREV